MAHDDTTSISASRHSRRRSCRCPCGLTHPPLRLRAWYRRSRSSERLYTVVCDERFDGSVAFANGLAKRGVPVTRFRGDITDFWYRDLSLLWREHPVAIAGATTHGPLFCLERWAWDHGLRVTYRGALTEAPGDEALIAWIDRAAPSAAKGCDMAIPPGVSASDWAQALKQFTDTVGAQWVFTSDEDVALLPGRVLAVLGRAGRTARVGGGRARHRRTGVDDRRAPRTDIASRCLRSPPARTSDTAARPATSPARSSSI